MMNIPIYTMQMEKDGEEHHALLENVTEFVPRPKARLENDEFCYLDEY